MKQSIAVFAVLAACTAVGTGTADAQAIYRTDRYYYDQRHYEPYLGPSDIVRIVRYEGYAPMSAPIRRGRTYVVPSMMRGGAHVYVVVDAYQGQIVRVRPVMAARPYGAPPPYDPRMAATPPRYGELPYGRGPAGHAGEPHNLKDYEPLGSVGSGGAPIPPGAVPGVNRGVPPAASRNAPNARTANAPGAASTPAAPARTPVPRPRPKVAAAPATAPVTAAPPPADAPPVVLPGTAATPAKGATPAKTATPPVVAAAPSTPAGTTGSGAAAAAAASEVPEAPPAPVKPATPLVPVAPLD